jgi:7,8-dihydroneopterin aldolase/epimerase/oxygenase
MIGTILLEGLEIACVVGIYPHERTRERDFAAAARTEDVASTVDYCALADALTALARERRYQLIETFAEEAAALLIARFGALRALVKVKKPGAVPGADWPAVRVERRP